MAKSLRSSARKANKKHLRRNVFGPAEVARAQRLSTKLRNLAEQPKSSTETKDGQTSKEESKSTGPASKGILACCKIARIV